MKINAATHTAQDHKVLHLRWRLLITLKQRQLSETTEQRQRTTKNEWDQKETNGRRYYCDINIQRNGFAPAHVVVRHKTSIVCIQCVCVRVARCRRVYVNVHGSRCAVWLSLVFITANVFSTLFTSNTYLCNGTAADSTYTAVERIAIQTLCFVCILCCRWER